MAYQGDPRGDPSNLMAYDSNYKPVTGAALQQAEVAKANAETNRISQSLDPYVRELSSEKGLREAQADQSLGAGEQARAAAWRARNVFTDKERVGYAQGGTVKDPRASRRMYAKGGPIFR